MTNTPLAEEKSSGGNKYSAVGSPQDIIIIKKHTMDISNKVAMR